MYPNKKMTTKNQWHLEGLAPPPPPLPHSTQWGTAPVPYQGLAAPGPHLTTPRLLPLIFMLGPPPPPRVYI